MDWQAESGATCNGRDTAGNATNSLNEDLKRVYELRELFSQRQDVQTTQDAINTLLPILQDSNTSKVLLRTTFTALITILSNVQAKSLPSDLVASLYKLLIPSPSIPPTQDEHLLSRLKLFSLTLAKSGQKLDRHILEAIVPRLAEACFFHAQSQADRRLSRINAAPSARIQINNPPPSLQSMGSFTLEPRSNAARNRPGRKSSMSSLSSRRSSRSRAASDSETSDSGGPRSRLEDPAAVRLESLKVVAALARLDTRALHPYWTSFFGPSATPSLLSLAQQDLSMAVRVQSMQTTQALLNNSKGYLDLARESKAKLAFIPLSQTLADIANDLNSQTLEILRTSFILKAEDYLIPALELACAVVVNSPYGRLATPHLDLLVSAVLENTMHITDSGIIEVLAELLRVVNSAQQSSTLLSDSTVHVVNETAEEIIERLLQDTSSDNPSWHASLWQLLAALLPLSAHVPEAEDNRSATFDLIEKTFIESTTGIQTGQIDCLTALSSTRDAKLPKSLLRLLLSSIPKIAADSVKSRIAALLVSLPDFLEEHVERMIEILSSLAANNNNKDVRISALKCIGTLLQSTLVGKISVSQQRCFDILLSNSTSGASSALRAEAFWNIANVVDAVYLDVLDIERLSSLLTTAIGQILAEGASRDAEMIRTSAIRVTGTLLSSMETIDTDTSRKAKAALATALNTGSPKTQWNAAAAMKKLILAKRLDVVSVNALLLGQRNSNNSKVQNSIQSAIEALPQGELEREKRLLAEVTAVEGIKDSL